MAESFVNTFKRDYVSRMDLSGMRVGERVRHKRRVTLKELIVRCHEVNSRGVHLYAHSQQRW
jgi:hypothetical protein